MKMIAVVSLLMLALGLKQHADARRKSGFSNGVRTDRAPRERMTKGPKTTTVSKYYLGAKPHKSKHPGPKHQDNNYKENGWY
jgi:hypothetical protein